MPRKTHTIFLTALTALFIAAPAMAQTASAPAQVVNPPAGVSAFQKKDQSSCPTGTAAVSGAPAGVLWCASTTSSAPPSTTITTTSPKTTTTGTGTVSPTAPTATKK